LDDTIKSIHGNIFSNFSLDNSFLLLLRFLVSDHRSRSPEYVFSGNIISEGRKVTNHI
jgi:hypothetical protein